MNDEYKSVEQKIWEWTAPAREYSKYAIKGLYAGIVSIFRIPTSTRKVYHGTDFGNRMLSEGISNSLEKTFTVSGLIGIVANIAGIGYSTYQASEGNNTQLETLMATLAITNALSGAYEWGRAEKLKKSESDNRSESGLENAASK